MVFVIVEMILSWRGWKMDVYASVTSGVSVDG